MPAAQGRHSLPALSAQVKLYVLKQHTGTLSAYSGEVGEVPDGTKGMLVAMPYADDSTPAVFPHAAVSCRLCFRAFVS